MKRVFYFLALSTLFMFAAGCGDDDDGGPTCAQSEFIGTYTGTDNCTGTGGTPSTSVVITAGANDNEIIVNGMTATIDGCNFSWGSTTLGTGITGSGGINGNELSYRVKSETIGTTVFECNFTGTK